MSWHDWALNNEAAIRLIFFFSIFLAMAFWEIRAPCRELTVSKKTRWMSNLGLIVLNIVVLRVLFPTAVIGMAAYTHLHGIGLLNYVDVPFYLSVFIGVVILDLVIYSQHVLVHYVPLLWRLHRVHHADLDYDVTTGLRFHTLEIVFSMLIKFLAVLLLGPPVVAVLIFEVLLNGMAMFNHSNVRLPSGMDKWVRWLVVTPDMHRVHHSIDRDETNRNFGFNLSCWDRLFGTYKDQPRAGHTGMTIGIPEFRNSAQVDKLPGMLSLPFKNSKS